MFGLRTGLIRGDYIEQYTPANGRITSTILKGSPQLKWARFVVSADCTVTCRDSYGDASVTLAAKAGVEYMFPVTEISAVSTGNIFILHDGEILLQNANN